MAELFVLCNIARTEAHPLRRRRALLALGDQLIITPRLSIAIERRGSELVQVWRVGPDEHHCALRYSAAVQCGDVTRVICRAASSDHFLLEVQVSALALGARLSIVRAA